MGQYCKSLCKCYEEFDATIDQSHNSDTFILAQIPLDRMFTNLTLHISPTDTKRHKLILLSRYQQNGDNSVYIVPEYID